MSMTTREVERIPLAEFHARIAAQGVPREHVAFRCPMCGAVQSMTSLIRVGVGTIEDVEKYIGFSCLGRWTDAGTPRKENEGKGCNWTLGGLFQAHRLEVETEDGVRHPHFVVATPDEARALMEKHANEPALSTPKE